MTELNQVPVISQPNPVASTFIIPQTEDLSKCVLNVGLHKIDWSANILLVDFSYLTFSRFFAMRTWYSMAHKDNYATLPKDHDWCKDKAFMEKYTQTYMNKVLTFCKQHKIPRTNIIYALDCRHNDNWRVQSSTGYKGTRAESHEKNDFYNFDIFGYTRKVILAPEQRMYGNLVFTHQNLEADDVIALLVKHITSTSYAKDLYILANDRDYIQLCENKVHLYDTSFKPISSMLLGSYLSAKEFLLKKILLGDVSDNIPSCYISKEFLARYEIKATKSHLSCTQKLVEQLLANPGSKQALLAMLDSCREFLATQPTPEYSVEDSQVPESLIVLPEHEPVACFKGNQFLYNARVIDFVNIPRTLVGEMTSIIQQVLP
jgi:5'-3' exonuclease